jgi:hypothetical protein
VRGLLLTVAHRPHWPDGGHYTSIADAAVPDATSFGWCALTAEQRDLVLRPIVLRQIQAIQGQSRADGNCGCKPGRWRSGTA